MYDFPRSDDWQAQFSALRKFLSSWHGIPLREDGNFGIGIAAGQVPAPLAALHALAGKRLPEICPQNKLLPLEELDLDSPQPVFYVENQGVYLWAYRAGEENPGVLGRFDEPGSGWEAEDAPLAEFLYEVCLFEAIMGAPYGASISSCPVDRLAGILGGWEPVPYGAWRWPALPTRFYAAGAALMTVSPNQGGHSIYCGAKEKKHLAFMGEFVSGDWEYCSFME
jgi:hypothetical protein